MDFQEHKMDQDSRGMVWERHRMVWERHGLVCERHEKNCEMDLGEYETDWDNYERILRLLEVKANCVTSTPEHLLVLPLSLAMSMFELTLSFKGIRDG